MNYSGKLSALLVLVLIWTACSSFSQQHSEEIDKKVEAFLNKQSGRWYDMNVPASDGKLLYDLIVENNYTRALEIGTSTGHSSIWIAWALSKTGGRLITVELDERRHQEAVANFKEAGVDHLIDARLADAHELVPELEGPFDFVFSDADKYWYKNYFLAVDPKLEVDGCYTTHNVSDRGRGGNRDYLEFLRGLDHYETTVDNRGGGMAVSFKKGTR
jgi:predicted O-methyltransferase YrrM